MSSAFDFNDDRPHTPSSGNRVEALREALRLSAPSLVRELFPAARFQGQEARIGSADGEPGESMSIVLAGEKAGQWFDHNPSSSVRQGDLITLWQMSVGGTFMEAVEDLELHLGLRAGAKWTGRVARTAEKRAKEQPSREAVTKSLVATHKYLSPDGNAVLAQVLRYQLSDGKKAFAQRNERGEWKSPEVRPLYNLPGITTQPTVVMVEGEKAADALIEAGVAATTVMGGADTIIDKTDWSHLRGKRVILWPDNDPPGVHLMRKVEEKLKTLNAQVVWVDVPANAPDKWDAADAEPDAAIGLLRAALEKFERKPVAQADRSLRFVSVADLRAMRPPRWLVDGLIPEGSFSVVVGPPASLKTFVVLDWCLCIATGLQWQEKPMSCGPVVYVAGEGQYGLANRVLGWLDHKGIGDDVPIYMVPQGVAMPTGQIEELLALISTMPEPPVMIVLDTLARTFGGGDENSQKDMNAYVAACDRLRQETGAAVLVVHHTGKDVDRGARGSSALTGAADAVVAVRRDGETVTLINTGPAGKQKDAEEHADILLRRAIHRFGDASTIILMKQEPLIAPDQPQEPPRGPTKNDLVLAMLQDADTRGLDGLGLISIAAAHFNGNKGNALRSLEALVKKGLIEECEGAYPKLWRVK